MHVDAGAGRSDTLARMRLIDLETWVQRLADNVRAGHPDEDSRVELKAEWPKGPQKAARRLAAQANAAGGAAVLWIIGLERKLGAIGAPYAELASWWNAVRARFDDGVEPTLLRSVNVPYEGVTLVGLLFETERAPYVITLAPPSGSVQREVPWRDATGARTARRQDLLRMLAPLRTLPEVETTECQVRVRRENEGTPQTARTVAHWTLDWSIFIVPRPVDALTTIMGHRSRLTLGYEDGGDLLMNRELVFQSESRFGPKTVHVTEPQFRHACHGLETEPGEVRADAILVATMSIAFAGDARVLVLRQALLPSEKDKGDSLALWRPPQGAALTESR